MDKKKHFESEKAGSLVYIERERAIQWKVEKGN